MARKKRRTKKPTQYEISRKRTIALRRRVPKALRPLFQHLINLADDSHAHQYFTRAGRELRQARKLAGES